MNASQPRTVTLPGAGLSLAADLYGDETDPPVVLLHGGGQTRHAWGGAAAAFAASGRFAISLDLRGHGHSDWSPDGVYGMTQFAGDVRAIASSLGRPPALVGASLGGLASLVAVGEASTPVASALVLVDVAPRIEVAGRVKIQAFMQAGMRGFDTLEDAADSIAAFIPHRPGHPTSRACRRTCVTAVTAGGTGTGTRVGSATTRVSTGRAGSCTTIGCAPPRERWRFRRCSFAVG